MEGQATTCLLDAGASINLIRQGLSSAPVAVEAAAVQQAAAGCKLNIVGSQTVELSISGMLIAVPCPVAPNLREEMLLAYPFFAEERIILDAARQCVYFGSLGRAIAYFGGTPPRAAPKRKFPTIKTGFPEVNEPEVIRLLRDFASVFEPAAAVSTTQSVKHDIRLTTSKPFRIRPYAYSNEKRRIIREQVQDMLAQGAIEPSTSL